MTYNFDDLKIILCNGVFNTIEHFKQKNSMNSENGGILLGYMEKKSIFIEKASIPTFYDKSTRFSFIRDKKSAQMFIDYEFLNSEGKLTYIGEWHTHPENKPTPSRKDLNMIKKQFYKNKFNYGFLFMLIVGIESNFLAIYNGKNLFKLK